MKDNSLTKAIIKKNKGKTKFRLKISLTGVKDTEDPYFLIIQSTASRCTRLTIYPVNKEKVIKISITGTDVSESSIEELSNILKNYEIIHTSGLLIKKKELKYECFLNLSLTDIKTKDLKISLNKIQNIFKEIKIQEIGLKKSKFDTL